MKYEVIASFARNETSSRTVVQYVNWILWLVAAWLALSVIVAIVAGRVVRARDEREIPPPVDEEDDDGMRDVG